MTDPITTVGLVASVIQIAGAGVKLSSALHQYTTSAAHADQDIADIAGDVESTSSALESVANVFSTQDTRPIVSEKAIRDATSIIKRCDVVFNDISEVVEKRRKESDNGQRRLSLLGKWSWPMKEKRVELHKKRLESLKNSLMLLLHVLQLAQTQAQGQVAEQTLREDRERIRELHQRQQGSLKSLNELEKKFRAFAPVDEETLQDATLSSRGLALESMSQVSPPETQPLMQTHHQSPTHSLVVDPNSQSPTAPDSSGRDTGEEDEHLSLEELKNAAKHVQELLKYITQLQMIFDVTQKNEAHHKKYINQVYYEFCRKWEADVIVLPSNSHKLRFSSPSFPATGNLGLTSSANSGPVPDSNNIYKSQPLHNTVQQMELVSEVSSLSEISVLEPTNNEISTRPTANAVSYIPVTTGPTTEPISTAGKHHGNKFKVRSTWGRPRVRKWFTSAAKTLGHQKINVSDDRYRDSSAHDFPETPGEPLRNRNFVRVGEQCVVLREAGFRAENLVSPASFSRFEEITFELAPKRMGTSPSRKLPRRKDTLELPKPVHMHRRRTGVHSGIDTTNANGEIKYRRISDLAGSASSPSAYSTTNYYYNQKPVHESGSGSDYSVPGSADVKIESNAHGQPSVDESIQKDIVDILLSQWTISGSGTVARR